MTLKDLVENNPVMFSLSLLLVGFLSGISAYSAILRIAHLETVASSHLTEQDQNIIRLTRETIESEKKPHC